MTQAGITGSCILTTYATNANGYANVKINDKNHTHHRVEYCKAHGVSLDSIKGLVVMHLCDNPSCVNPAHLRLGTVADNILDMHSKKRNYTPRLKGEDNPSCKLTVEQVLAIRTAGRRSRHTDVAKAFGVSASTVNKIVSKKIWGHLPE